MALMSEKHDNGTVIKSYCVYAAVALLVMRACSDFHYSAILTVGAAAQCTGFSILLANVVQRNSAAGLSQKSLILYGVAYACRLCSTLCKRGYVPMDRTGDILYPLIDVAGLVLIVTLLRMYEMKAGHAQRGMDDVSLQNLLLPCVVLAFFVHGDLNDSFFFDTMWTIGMNVETVALVPQLLLLAKAREGVEAVNAHFVAWQCVGRACVFAFWFFGYVELNRWRKSGVNFAGYALLGACACQVFMSANFVHHYVNAVSKGRRLVLPGL